MSEEDPEVRDSGKYEKISRDGRHTPQVEDPPPVARGKGRPKMPHGGGRDGNRLWVQVGLRERLARALNDGRGRGDQEDRENVTGLNSTEKRRCPALAQLNAR